MKKLTLLLSALLIFSLSTLAQIKMYLHFNDGTRVEYVASRVDSITFDSQGVEPDAGFPGANGYEYVDLGLPSGLLWATMNVGADSPEDYGDYFAWGETQPKYTCYWDTYKWCEGSSDTQTKYCIYSDYGIVDNKTILELSDDAAKANWGGSWRMPTKAEIDELRTKCTWTWEQKNGVKGYKVTSKTNGNSIFLPAAGYRSYSTFYNMGSEGHYWSSSLSSRGSCYAYDLDFDSRYVNWSIDDRCVGRSVRPVLP